MRKKAFVFAIIFFVNYPLWAAPRIAFLPSFSDFEMKSPMRAALPAFDARLQAELLNGWDSEVLSRAGLSTVVFEQKLRAAKDPSVPTLRVLPSDFLVLSVLDQSKKQLRVFVNPVSTGMTLGEPRIFPIDNPENLAKRLPQEVARHVAGVAGLKARSASISQKPNTKKPLTCSLLEPINAAGAEADLAQTSPLIRAVLENLVASDEIGATLVERTETMMLLEEKALAVTHGLNPNGATNLGRMAKADLILIPFIHSQKADQISTDLFAVDVATGQMLACRSWTGGIVDSPPVKLVQELLQEGLQAAAEAMAQPAVDNPSLRHAEAGFLIGLKDGWNGLRQSAATVAELSMRLGDSSLALVSDDETLMRNASKIFYRAATPTVLYPLQLEFRPDDPWLIEVESLRKSGQLDLIRTQARQIFELPMTELAQDNSDYDLKALAELSIRLGDAEQGWSILTRSGQPIQELANKPLVYEVMVLALINLGRYQDCIDLLENRGKWSSFCTVILVDAYRALGNKKREFDIMSSDPTGSCKTAPMTARFLDLGIDQGKAGRMINVVTETANSWVNSSPLVKKSMLRARVAAGQKDLAISDAQCAFIAAVKAKDSTTQNEMTSILTELGAKAIPSLPAAREFISFPSQYRIDLIHDQTLDPKYVSEVAAHVAPFWGCAVHIRLINLKVSEFSSYQRLSQSLDTSAFTESFSHVSLPDGPSIGTIFLTQTKLISKQKNYKGDVYSLTKGSFTLLSDHYFRKFKSTDPRPLPLITAIATAKLSSISKILRAGSKKQKSDESAFLPPPPDLFSDNGSLSLVTIDLGISPGTGALLKEITPAAIMESITILDQKSNGNRTTPNASDQTLIADLSEQIAQVKPVIVNP